MTNATILLEERKEVTTFLLDEGTITETTVITAVGETPGYAYSKPLKVYDFVTLSDKSEIGNIAVKKFDPDDDLPIFGMIVNDPRVKENDLREAGVLVLGHLARFKLAASLSDIDVNDLIYLGENGAIADEDGTWYAMHPVDDSDDYNYIEAFMPYEKQEGGSTTTGST